jgi:NtrC-family two-component system response regulator AlgB
VPLAQHFAQRFARSHGGKAPTLSETAQKALRAHAWPGNVRELRNVVERAMILHPGPMMEAPHLGLHAAAGPPVVGGVTVGGDVTLEALEHEHIQRVISRCATQEEAARILGVDPSTLWRKKKKR